MIRCRGLTVICLSFIVLEKSTFKYYLLWTLLLSSAESNGQRRYSFVPVRIPYSTSLNITFGQGAGNIGTPLPATKTGFNFSSASCPLPGQYTVVNKSTCPNWTEPKFCNFHGPLKNPAYWDNYFFRPEDSSGYVMYVNNTGSTTPKIVFTDTVQNLCGGGTYQFFASIIMAVPETANCPGPDFTFLVRTTTGQVLQSYTAKDVNYFSRFTLPAGETSCIVSITVEPRPSTIPLVYCQSEFAIDDIQLIPYGPQPTIKINGFDSLVVVAGTCFQSTVPVVINSRVDTIYQNLFTGRLDTVTPFTNPAYQWEKSSDGGIEWADIPGAAGPVLSAVFNTPDTILLRLRISDAAAAGNKNCAMVSNIIKLHIDGLPTGYTISNNSPVCSGEDIKFSAENAASFIWSGPNGFSDNSPFPTIASASLSDSGMYYVQVFSFGGCYSTDSIRVSVIGTDVHAGPDTAICKGRPVRLQASKGVSYLWSPSTGLSGTTTANPLAMPDVTTIYSVKVTDSSGCADTANVTVTVLNKTQVKAAIAATDYLCRSFDSVYFASSSIGDINKWFWDFGNGNTSIAATPPVQHYLIPAGRILYYAKLMVTDATGCADSTVHVLNVVENCYIAVPNAFTPNGDGLNDYLYPLNAYKATNLSFKVFNRLGQLVFATKDRTQKWDGKIRGVNQETGVYVWMLEYDDVSSRRVSLKGTTLLIR